MRTGLFSFHGSKGCPIDRRLVRLKVTKTTIRTCLKGTESKLERTKSKYHKFISE